MKDITPKLIELFKQGYCSPQIARIAKKLQEPSTTIHYNIKKLESNGIIKTYKPILDHKKVDQGFCTFVLINLEHDEYKDPEKLAEELSKLKQIESVDICTGDCEILIKVRTKDQDEYYNFIKNVLSRDGITQIKTFTSLKQLKSEFVNQKQS